mgnify:CR=1 FL=1
MASSSDSAFTLCTLESTSFISTSNFFPSGNRLLLQSFSSALFFLYLLFLKWSKGVATSLVNKNWIFICPVICIIIRYLLKPFIYAKLQMNNYYGEIITEYLTNYMCFIVLSVEIFSILFTFGVVKSVVVLLFVDTAIFIGLLVVGLVKMDLRGKEVLWFKFYISEITIRYYFSHAYYENGGY